MIQDDIKLRFRSFRWRESGGDRRESRAVGSIVTARSPEIYLDINSGLRKSPAAFYGRLLSPKLQPLSKRNLQTKSINPPSREFADRGDSSACRIHRSGPVTYSEVKLRLLRYSNLATLGRESRERSSFQGRSRSQLCLRADRASSRPKSANHRVAAETFASIAALLTVAQPSQIYRVSVSDFVESCRAPRGEGARGVRSPRDRTHGDRAAFAASLQCLLCLRAVHSMRRSWASSSGLFVQALTSLWGTLSHVPPSVYVLRFRSRFTRPAVSISVTV